MPAWVPVKARVSVGCPTSEPTIGYRWARGREMMPVASCAGLERKLEAGRDL